MKHVFEHSTGSSSSSSTTGALSTLYSNVLQPTTVNSIFTTHVLQCHIYFVIIPLLIPHPPGLYGIRNGSLALLNPIVHYHIEKI